MFRKAVSVNLLTLCWACTSSSGAKVIERADSLSDTPAWASVTKASFEDEKNKYFVAWIEVPGDRSKSAALTGADRKAIDAPWVSLTQEFFEQIQTSEDLAKDSNSIERITSEVRGSRPQASIVISKRYWEIVEVKKDTGIEYDLRAYSLAEIPKSEYTRAKREYFDRLNKNPRVQKIKDEIGSKQRENVLNKSDSSDLNE